MNHAPDAGVRMRVTLCIVTFLRPHGLAQLLDAIGRLDVASDVDVRVVVVDNDAEESARPVVDERATHRFPMRYIVEPKRGIAYARNAALAAADESDLVGFIDDDEEPEPTWLSELLALWRRTGAAVVLGPSLPSFPDGTPQWIIDGGFFDRQRFETGADIEPVYARTSGVLISSAALRDHPTFDTTHPLTGGEDVELFHRFASSGGRIVWSDDAHVVEHVPLSRANLRWLLLRQYRIGNANSLRLLPTGPRAIPRRARRFAGGMLRAAMGVAGAAAAIPRGRAAQVRSLQRAAKGFGFAVGALGISYKEYRVVHGD